MLDPGPYIRDQRDSDADAFSAPRIVPLPSLLSCTVEVPRGGAINRAVSNTLFWSSPALLPSDAHFIYLIHMPKIVSPAFKRGKLTEGITKSPFFLLSRAAQISFLVYDLICLSVCTAHHAVPA